MRIMRTLPSEIKYVLYCIRSHYGLSLVSLRGGLQSREWFLVVSAVLSIRLCAGVDRRAASAALITMMMRLLAGTRL